MSGTRHNLPHDLTSFVGRHKELAELRRLVLANRMVTVTGSGGSGKTRLALELVRDLPGFSEGLWLVDLSSLTDPELVPQAVGEQLHVADVPGRAMTETLLQYVDEKQLLLLFDNCEHLIDECARLAEEMLRACPRLRILATSREPLGIPGELTWPIPSMALPDLRRGLGLASLRECDSACLFLERARSAGPGLALTPSSAKAVAQICYRLDGVPLALELAAARVRVLSFEEIADRLDDCFSLLSTGTRTGLSRHRTLRATMDWSYQLLSTAEQSLLQGLSVFAGGFSIDAVEAVCKSEASQQAVLDLIGQLVDKSLVLPRQIGGHSRYRLLETVRQYGLEKLGEAGCRPDLEERHARYFLAVAENIAAESGPTRAWMNTLETEQGNLRAALSWSLRDGNDPTTGIRLAAALSPFWSGRGDLREGRDWLRKALVHEHFADAPPATRAAALNGAGMLAIVHDDAAEAKELIEQGLELYRELHDVDGIAASLVNLGSVAWIGERSDIPIADILAEAVSLKPELKDQSTLALLLTLEGGMALAAGQPDRAVQLNLDGLSLFRRLNDVRGTAMTLMNAGLVQLHQGLLAEAAASLRESLGFAHSISHSLFLQYSLIGLAGVAAAEGHPRRAARLWAVADALGERHGTRFTPAGRTLVNYDESVATVRAQLGKVAWDQERAKGEALSMEEVIAFAMAETASASEVTKKPESTEPLSAREIDVLRLVAEGLTSAGIADRLFLSTRTVDWHLSAIYRKLGLHTRSEATRFAIEHHYL